ncbi:MAG: RNA methyltransferase [Phycisphaerae bacterium]|nr:RNA methyltransferase [Phycisphaerae bacterium]
MTDARSIVHIQDALDPRIDDYRSVRDRDARGLDGRPGLFVGETRLVVDRMLAIPGLTKSVFVAERHASQMRTAMNAIDAAPAGNSVPLFAATESVLQTIAGFNVHRGILAIGHRPHDSSLTLDAAIPRRERLTLLLCDEVTNIDNVGALYRNAAAFGVDAVVLSRGCHDHLYRKCIRVSMGHAIAMPTARSIDWPRDIARLRDEWDLTVLGAATGEKARCLDDVARPERVGVLVGSEYAGLSRESLRHCDALVRIPMAPGIDSLNVAVAAAVCLHRFACSPRM